MGERAKIVGDGQARCDLCFGNPGVWRYALPVGLDLVKVQDVKTGNVYSPLKSAGAFLVCEECRGIMDVRAVPVDVLPECFARRMMNRQPLVRGMDKAKRTFMKKGLVSLNKRVLVHMLGQTPERYVLGSDPLQGRTVVLPGPCPPDAGPDVMPRPTVN